MNILKQNSLISELVLMAVLGLLVIVFSGDLSWKWVVCALIGTIAYFKFPQFTLSSGSSTSTTIALAFVGFVCCAFSGINIILQPILVLAFVCGIYLLRNLAKTEVENKNFLKEKDTQIKVAIVGAAGIIPAVICYFI